MTTIGSPSVTPPPSQDPRAATILRIARKRFMADGYVATRMEPIAREAAVSTATLYGYYPSKADLFSAVIDDCARDFGDRMTHVRASPQGSAQDQISAYAVAYAQFMADAFVRSVFRLVVTERPRFHDEAMRFFEKGRLNFGAPLIDAIRRLDAAGHLNAPRASWAAGHLMGMIEHPVFFVPMLSGDGIEIRRTPEDVAEDAVQVFLARYRA